MRRIADELGAGTMTLYHYIRTKDDLKALMDDAIMASTLVVGELPEDWRAAVHLVALASYRAFMKHPWALDSLRGARFGPNGMRHVEQSLKAVASAPFDDQGKLDALGIVDDYVFGHVMRRSDSLQQKELEAGKPSRSLVKFADQMMATGEFPHLAALLAQFGPFESWGKTARAMNDAGRFHRGLEALLDGLEARYVRPPHPAKRR